MKNQIRTLLAVVLVAQLCVSSFAQQPAVQKPATAPVQQQPQATPSPTPPPTGTQAEDDVVQITTNLVQVDPVITDSKGKQITDLRADEVEIREDGKPQKITNFSYVSLGSSTVESRPVQPSGAPSPPVKLRPEQVRRTIALVVDDLGLSFESAYYVRRALKKFLDEQMQPDDLVAIIRTGGGIGALQQFTSDKRQLYAAVEKVKWNPSGRSGVSAFSPISGSDRPQDFPEAGNSNAGEELDQFREDLFAVGTLGAVNYIVRGLRTLPGRKSILLISDGFKVFTRSDPGGSQRILGALRSLTDLANRASVVIYTMDSRGLPTMGLMASDSTAGLLPDQLEERLSNRRMDFFESQSGLNYLAQQTGGLAIRNSNDLNAGIRKVVEDQQGYYLIGYRPDDATFDRTSGRRKFHKLSLKVLRPGKFTVRMRNGFYGITDEEAVPPKQTATRQLIGALTSPFGSEGVHVRLTSLFANDARFGSVMRSMLHVKGSDLTFTNEPDGWHKATFDILAFTFGDNGAVVDQVGRTHTMQLKGASYERVIKDGFTYNLSVPIKKAGAYQLRTAVRDVASERVGSASQFVEVPDIKKNRLTLSGLMVRGTTLQAYQKTPGASAPQGDDDTTDDTDARATPAVRQFKSQLVMLYGFVIYNAQQPGGRQPQVQTQVKLFRNGQPVFTGKETPLDLTNQTDPKRLTAAGAIQLGTQMEPGEYVIQVIVTDLLAKEKNRVATQWTDFEIVK